MYLPILLSLVILASAKTIYLENDFEEVLPAISYNQDRIWVLKFDDDFEVNPLRPPSKVELKIFKRSIQPVIKRNRRIREENENAVDFSDSGKFQPVRVKPDMSNATVEVIKLQLKEIINKFLHSVVEADPTQCISSKRDKNTSLKIFFERNSSALVLQSGRYRNVYYSDAEDGLLPRWFFEEHDIIECDAKGDFIPIPEEVKPEFYEDLLHLVKTLYGYAI
ncbi:uncharacterized protein LOC121730214 [Aricia agestis]|uniref:uncharacterized protein LOC121730214 n=1 Tax=Aricia agestis TaxID=91739 RepID=UPI001C206A21|nr:uncharacterized protein LOC121730214 [Aricia agestis]